MLFICGMESYWFWELSKYIFWGFFSYWQLGLYVSERLQLFGSFQYKQCKQDFENFIKVVPLDSSEL